MIINRRGIGLVAGMAAAVVLSAGALIASTGPASAAVTNNQAAPDFTLTNSHGEEVSLSDFAGQRVVLEWTNHGCPFVKKHHQHNKTMANLASEYKAKGVKWIAINTGEKGKQGAGLDRNKKAAGEFSMKYPILLDTSGDIGRLYGARTTPHMYVIDSEGVLKYAGAIDNNPSARQVGDVNYVEEALDAVLAGETVETPTSRPYGCSVKY